MSKRKKNKPKDPLTDHDTKPVDGILGILEDLAKTLEGHLPPKDPGNYQYGLISAYMSGFETACLSLARPENDGLSPRELLKVAEEGRRFAHLPLLFDFLKLVKELELDKDPSERTNKTDAGW